MDTDKDGIPDDPRFDALVCEGHHAAQRGPPIVRRAIFATFGLSGSPYALFVYPDSTAVHIDSNAAPMLYDQRPKTSRGIRVGWRLVEKEGDRATVEIRDYIGPLAASIRYVPLERKGAEWFVIDVALGMIS
jgi:hypothetical protein